MFTGAVAVSMAPFAAIWGWKIWLAVNVGVTAVLLLITAFVGSRLAKGNAADSVKDTAGSVPIGA
jgi:hypothetical protein